MTSAMSITTSGDGGSSVAAGSGCTSGSTSLGCHESESLRHRGRNRERVGELVGRDPDRRGVDAIPTRRRIQESGLRLPALLGDRHPECGEWVVVEPGVGIGFRLGVRPDRVGDVGSGRAEDRQSPIAAKGSVLHPGHG